MKKRIIVVIFVGLVCLLVGFLAGYLLTPEPSDFPRLSRWTQSRIEKAWETAGNGKLYWVEPPDGNGDRYYGTCEGYDIFFWGTCHSNGRPYSIVIGSYSFDYRAGFGLYAHKGGEIFELKKLYADSKISEEAIAAAHRVHQLYESLS